jgi:LmbE family N-acetylglucosaminyl deacetylase
MTIDIATMGQVVAVSPHMDDAVLSCSGLIAGARAAAVITVFAGFPAPHTAVTEWDRESGFADGDDVVAIRRAEDRAALARLGAKPVWLDFLDSQYVLDPLQPATPSEVAVTLRAALGDLKADTIALPLGLSHTDHECTHEACVLLLRESPELAANWVAFTDVPYRALHARQAADRLDQLAALGYDLEPFSLDLGDRKAQALGEYPSQLRALAPQLENATLPEQCYLLVRR